MSERNSEDSVHDLFPPGFTFSDYLTNTPAVTGTIMRNMVDFRVSLPSQLLVYDQSAKTARVAAADGVIIEVVNIDPPLSTVNNLFIGKVIDHYKLQVEEYESLPDDYDFERGARVAEHLCRLSTWGIEASGGGESEDGDGNQSGGSDTSGIVGAGASGHGRGRGHDRGNRRGHGRCFGRGHGRGHGQGHFSETS